MEGREKVKGEETLITKIARITEAMDDQVQRNYIQYPKTTYDDQGGMLCSRDRSIWYVYAGGPERTGDDRWPLAR